MDSCCCCCYVLGGAPFVQLNLSPRSEVDYKSQTLSSTLTVRF